MSRQPPRPMTPFDEVVNPPNLYIWKLLIPYLPQQTQRILGIYVKFMEFQYTLDYFRGFSTPHASITIEDLKDYVGPEVQDQMEQMEQMMNMMEMMNDLQSDDWNHFDNLNNMEGKFDDE